MQEMNNEGILTRNNDIKRNAEGYNDPTPYNAIKNTEKMTHTYPRRGWVYDLDDRMALVVSNDDNNRMSNSVSIVFVYPTAIMNPLPTHVDMVCGIARCEKIASYRKDKFGKERFSVSACEMGRIEKAMMTALDIEILPAVPKADDDKKLFAMTLERNMYRSMYESLIDRIAGSRT